MILNTCSIQNDKLRYDQSSDVENIISEGEWKRWQAIYAVLRNETFQRLLDVRKKRSPLFGKNIEHHIE